MTKKSFEYYIFNKSDPDPLFPEVDARIRIHIKIKCIRNTGRNGKKYSQKFLGYAYLFNRMYTNRNSVAIR